MPVNKKNNLVYGLSNPLQRLPQEPIVSTRNPTTSDKAELGTAWINKSTNGAYFLTSISSNSATWTSLTTIGGLTIATGDLTVVTGDIEATAGSITAGTTVTAGTGISSTTGDIVATAGKVAGVTGLESSAGGLTVSLDVRGRQLIADGDAAGTAGTTTITNGDSTPVSTGVGSIKMTTANPSDSTGFLEVYVGTSKKYVPYFDSAGV